MRCFVVMGVSGCGKSSVGQAVSDACDIAFVDGDDLHPPANIAKMASGAPLNDDDRAPWLADVGQALAKAEGPVVIACSALKRVYRDKIRSNAGETVHFLHLHAPQAVLAKRVKEREGHFMPPSLLESQYATLEHLGNDETGNVIDISQPLNAVTGEAAEIVRKALV